MTESVSSDLLGPSKSGDIANESTPGCSSIVLQVDPSTSFDSLSRSDGQIQSVPSSSTGRRTDIPLDMVIEMEEFSNYCKKKSNGKGKEMTMERYFYLKYRHDLKREEERREERKRKAFQEKIYREKKLKLMKLKITVLRELVKAVTKKRRLTF